MPAKSLKHMVGHKEGYVIGDAAGNPSSIRWVDEEVEDNTDEVCALIAELPVGTRIKLSQVQTIHVIDENVIETGRYRKEEGNGELADTDNSDEVPKPGSDPGF